MNSDFEDDEKINFDEGTFSVDTNTWGATIFIKPFKEVPIISLMRKNGKSRNLPTIYSVTPDAFTVKINSSDQAGEYLYRARGELLKPTKGKIIDTPNKITGNISKQKDWNIIKRIFHNDGWQNNIILYIVVMVIGGIIVGYLLKKYVS